MFSKRPRRDKILVALTALVATTATVVPLALIYGIKHEASTTPVAFQPTSGVEPVNTPTTNAQGYRVLSYDPKWTPKDYLTNYLSSLTADQVAPDVAPKTGFVTKGMTTLVTAASPQSVFFANRVQQTLLSDINESKVIDAGTKWDLVYSYAPAPGFSGAEYTYTIRFSVEPLQLPAPASTELTINNPPNLVYGEGLPVYDFNDRVIFPTPDHYVLNTTPATIKTYRTSQQETNAVPVSDAKTVPAGSYLVVTFEMKPDFNHAGDTIVVKGIYIVNRAPATNLPSPDPVTGLTLAHGTTLADPGPTQAQKDAAVAAKYKPYSSIPTLTITKVEQGQAATYTVGQTISSSDASNNLQSGSTFTAKWTATYDTTADPNHSADPSYITHEYTVVKGNFGPSSNGWAAYNTPTTISATITSISIDATDMPSISEAFSASSVRTAPAPFANAPESTWRIEYSLQTTDGTGVVPVATMDDVRRYLNAPNSNYAPRLYATLFLPMDDANWKFNAPDDNSPGETGTHEFRWLSNIGIDLNSSSSNP